MRLAPSLFVEALRKHPMGIFNLCVNAELCVPLITMLRVKKQFRDPRFKKKQMEGVSFQEDYLLPSFFRLSLTDC